MRYSCLVIALMGLYWTACTDSTDPEPEMASDATASPPDAGEDPPLPAACSGYSAQILAPVDGEQAHPPGDPIVVEYSARAPDLYTSLSTRDPPEMGSFVPCPDEEQEGNVFSSTCELEPDTEYWYETGWFCFEGDGAIEVVLARSHFRTAAE